MSGWVRAKDNEKAKTRLVCQYDMPTTEYQDIENLLQHIPWGKGNTVTLAAMQIGARVINSLIDQGLTLDEALAKASALMGSGGAAPAATPATQAPTATTATANAVASPASPAGGATDAPGRDGYAASTRKMFADD